MVIVIKAPIYDLTESKIDEDLEDSVDKVVS